MIDDKLKPWLIEVNLHPSLSCDTPLDKSIKLNLLKNTFHMIGVTPFNRNKITEDSNKLNYLDGKK
jgi:hypothetical protein